MLSRNNNKLLIHKLEPKKQRFAIRKISVGVASVLIGFTFAGFSGVSADEATTTAKDHLKTEATAESSSVPTKEVELTSSDEAQAKEVEQTTSAETPAKEAETTPVTDDKAQVAEDTKEQAPAQAVTAEETSEPTTSTEKQTVAPADENEASETQTFNVEKQAEHQAKVDLTDSKVAYAAAPTQAQDQQEEGFSVTDPDYSKYTYGKTNLQTLIDDLGIDYKNSEYVFQWIASTDWERGIIFTVDRGRDADGNVILTGNGSFNAYEYSFLDEYHITKAKTVIQKGQQTLNFGQVINDESKDAIAVDHFYSKIERGFFYRTQKSYLPIFVGGHSGIESNTGDGYTTLSIYTPQVVEQKAKINNGKVYKTQTGLTGQNYKTGVPKSAKVEEGKFLYAENSEGTMSEFHKGVVLVNNYHDGVTVRYTELDNQGTMQYEFLDNRGFAKKLYNESTRRNESREILHVGQSFTYEGDSGKYHISNPYVQQTTDITYEYRKLGSVELYDENGNYLDQGYRYVNDANDAAKASLPEVPKEFPQGDIEYTLVAKEDLPSDLSRSIKYIYRGIETKVTHDTYTLTTKFVDESGNELKAAEPQTITWTTTTKRDIHTNEIISQTSVPSEASYMAVNSPVIAGYYATTPGLGSRKAEQKNATQEIVYRKLGNIIAKDSQGNDLTKVQYENDANDATKIKAIVAPTIKGYHVKSEVVQPSDPGQDTVLNYGKDIQVAQIKYWDKTAHKYITDDQGNDLETIETGAHNTKISHEKVAEQIHALEAKGYKYNSANQEFSTVYFDDDDSKPQTFTVKLIHGTTTELESKQITREIHIHHPKQKEEVVPQTATFTRTGTKDLVTGKTTWNAWSPAQKLAAYTAPKVDGYTADKSAAQLTVNANDEIAPVDIYYTANDQEVLIKYVDVDNNNKEVKSQSLDGVTDQTVDTKYEVPANYELVAGQDLPKAVTFKANGNEPIIVKVKHKKVSVEVGEKDTQNVVTRKITVHRPDGTTKDASQTATFTRTGTKDLVTGKTTWNAWSPAQKLAAYTAPKVDGYTADKSVAQLTVNANDEIAPVDIYYTANDQEVLIKYVDVDNNNKEVKSQSLDGVTDQTVDTKYEVPANYELVAGQDLPKAVTFKANGNEPIIVKVKHKKVSVEVGEKDTQNVVTRKITVHRPDGTTKDASQTATFTRTGTKDLVTGKTTWNAWSPAQKLAAYTAPKVDGYTADKSVAQLTVNANDEIAPVDIYYTANDQEVLIKYVDVDNNNKEVKSQSLDGVTDQTVDTKYEVPANYELVAGQDLPKAVTFKANGNEPIIVKVKHKKVSVEVGEKDTQNVVTRKITVHRPDGTTKDASQTATFTRTGTKDLVTGKTTWNAWSPAQKLAAYTAPKVDGYTADKSVAQLTVNANDEIAPVDIYYTANDQKVMIKYVDVDNNNKEVKSQSLDGVTDQTVDTKYEVPANYELVAGQDLPKAVTFKANGNEPIIVKVKHKKVSVEVGEKDTQNVVTRKITVHRPDGTTKDASQTATFTRTGTKDLVTGKTTWNAWSPAQKLAAYTAPKVDGYTADKSVAQLTVNANDEIAPVDIYYTANDQEVLIKYVDVDNNNKEVKSQSLDGVTDQTVDTKYEVPANYELVAGQDLPKAVTFKANGNEPIIVKVKHKKVSVEVGEKDTQNVVTRKITVHRPDGTTKDASQTATFTRTGTKDLVTGKTTWNAWSPAQKLAAYTAPKVDGYTADKSVAQLTVNANDEIAPVDIYYTANDQEVLIKYVDVDNNNKEVKSQSLDGVTDQTVDTKYEVPANYELVAGQDLPKAVTFKANGNEPIIVKVKHKKVSVEVGEKDTQNVVTRKITVHRPDGTTKDASQTATFTRTGTKDLVTGKTTWNAWSPAQKLAAYTAPKVDGYTADKSVAQLTVNANDEIAPVDIYYTANDQKVMIKYVDVDNNNKEVKSQSVSGKTDQTVDVNYEVPANYEEVADQDLPGKVTFKAKDNEPIIVKVKHKHQDVTDEYKNDAHKQDKVDHTVTRTVIVKHPHATDDTRTEALHFTRQVTRDMATGQDTFGEWIPDTVDFFEGFAIEPKASDKGYTHDKTSVDRLEHITGDTKDTIVTVGYTANDQKAHVHYIDDTTGKKLEVVHVTGKTDEPIKHDSKAKVQGYLDKGYELVSDGFAKAGKPSYNAEDEDQHFEIHLKHGSKVVKADPSNADSQKEVKRTIIVNAPDGTKTTKVQTVVFTRDGSKDLVTGKISYPDWDEIATKAFSQDDVPQYLGYTSMVAGRKQTTIAAKSVRPTDADQVIEVSYVARPSQQVITYQDENGNQIGTQVITGHTDETVKLVPVLPDGWELLDPDSLPENVTFAPEENPVLVITVKRTATEDSAKTEKTGENTEVAEQEVVNDTTDVTTNEKNEATLPQMGESDTEALAFSLLGLVTAAFSLFYFGKERRKTDN